MTDEATPTGFSALLGFFKNALGVHETRKVRVTEDGRLHFAEGDPTDGEFRTAICLAGAGTAVVPGGSEMGAIAAADILKWTFPTGKKRLSLISGKDDLTGHTGMGWVVTWNAGSPTAAKLRLAPAAGTPSKYAAGASVQSDTNHGVVWLPPGAAIKIPSAEDITDMYFMPLTSAATQVGNQFLSGVAS